MYPVYGFIGDGGLTEPIYFRSIFIVIYHYYTLFIIFINFASCLPLTLSFLKPMFPESGIYDYKNNRHLN